MSQFSGFPARMEFTPVPNYFLSVVLPQISDIWELKTTLHVLAALYRRKGYPRFVAGHELLGNDGLMKSLRGGDKAPEELLRRALEMASQRGTFIHIVLDRDGSAEDIYLLNTEADRKAADRIKSGELKLSGLKAAEEAHVELGEPPDIFTLYEQNIGMLTPIIADELREAEKLYPESWLRDAIKEAVALNKRNIRYIMRILERWSTEGKTDGTYQRVSKTDPDKYIKGKYGHMVRR
ncbi:MAG: DnaD domain protein [Dehalococcoidia bacterium]|nr:MAG: DnaD domain protein [Dehalococcoidia bacterium]